MKPDVGFLASVLAASLAGLLAGMLLAEVYHHPATLRLQDLQLLGAVGTILGLALAMSAKRLRQAGAILGTLSLILAAAVTVRSSQRSLLIVAEADISITEVDDWNKEVGKIPVGASRRVLRCEDNKHYISPVIQIESGGLGVPKPPYRIVVRDTGPLSAPQFLGCGDY